jgi:serine/threonine-protein kinase RsbW
MDWLIDRSIPESGPRVLADLRDHLLRHAAQDANVDGAVESVRGSIADLPLPADGSLLRLHLDWRAERPMVVLGTVPDLGVSPVPAGNTGAVPAAERGRLDVATTSVAARIPLEVDRQVQETFDDGPPPMPSVDTDPRRDGAASVAIALAAAATSHPTSTPEQMASLAGTVLADAVTADAPPRDGRSAAQMVVDAHHALGGEARVLAADDSVVEVAVSRCPFGAGVASAPSLCHVTTGLAGRLAARVHGSATVLLDESIGTGDPECHLQVWLQEPEEQVRGERHRWPPTAANSNGPTPHLDLSLSLPRESGSVPVVRRLAAQALRTFGVAPEDVDDVQLAITEACANVVDHAADTDTYEVKVELATERCAITVVDQGGGFDASVVPDAALESDEAGRGMALMRALVDNVAFRSEPQAGAVVHMVKTLRYDGSHPLHRHLSESTRQEPVADPAR